jgi:hypothetical protein
MQFISLNDMPEEFQNMVKKQYVEAVSNVKPYGVVYQEASQGLGSAMAQLMAGMTILEEAQTVDDLNLSWKVMNSAIRKLDGMLGTLDASIGMLIN